MTLCNVRKTLQKVKPILCLPAYNKFISSDSDMKRYKLIVYTNKSFKTHVDISINTNFRHLFISRQITELFRLL